ncbi:unnamed protein product [Rotaria magnacalcarata]|uniref:Uncharacterized protein n=2 Tax=Rotaria magnacalcarata TaxID=392030 RepID=A0A816N9H3_9BILA|nr:unnamed protein product [Rotaria magnacalcarata]
MNFATGQDMIDSPSPNCGCCPSPYCRATKVSCSTNSDCECLLMAMTGAGMCADTIISCKDLLPCENDNQTCLVPNTVCVNNTQCNVPVCYPIDRASPRRCPSLISGTISNNSSKLFTNNAGK